MYQRLFKNTITKDKKSHYITIKGSSQQEDITFINIYTSNMRAPKYIKQILTDLRGEIDSNRIIFTLTLH